MTAASGETCEETLWSGAPYLWEVVIPTPPSHGKVSINGIQSFSYTADSEYVGSDSFAVDYFFGFGGGFARQVVNVTVVKGAAPSESLIVTFETYLVVHPAQVHEKPSLSSSVVKTLPAGQKITVVGQVIGQDWYLVSEDDDPIGYVKAGDLAKVP